MTVAIAKSLSDIIRMRAEQSVGDTDMITYRQGGSILERVSSMDLLERAQRAAYALRENGVEPGDRVLLMLAGQSDFVDAFFGAAWAGAIPVPLFPPILSVRPADFIANFSAIAKTSGARVLVASDEVIRLTRRFAKRMGRGFRIVPRSSWDDAGERLEQEPSRSGTDLALLQYTSGSTGTPKGVALTHDNILANAMAIGEAVSLGKEDVGVSWLPLYHDMGLIGVLATLYRGGQAVLLGPQEFARDPGSWLRAISAHGGTLSPAPNFAYRRCLQLPDDSLHDIDLSTWRVAFNGSEPVDADTVHRFIERFAARGFRASAFYPVYGLAEHTLAVSFPAPDQGVLIDTVDRNQLASSGTAVQATGENPDTVDFVSVGTPLAGVTVEIRDEQGTPVPNGHVGEICVKSASVMSGYFGDEAATADVLTDGWLRTGDLGYFRKGMLFVTGRKKDLIIRAGRNYHPEDIEHATATVHGVRAGRAAAFAVPAESGEEHVVVLAESFLSNPEERDSQVREIASAVVNRVGFRPETIELCKRGMLPVTSSGKVRRQVARAQFLNRDLAGR